MISCKQSGCRISQGGRCIEGFEPPNGCPHYFLAVNEDDAVSAGGAAAAQTAVQFVPLRTGDALNAADASDLMCRTWPRLIMLAGEASAGKTTLLAGIYSKFLRSKFAGLSFAGSLTLPAFERRCHLARIASGRTKPDTERTKGSEGIRYLHLRIRDTDPDRCLYEMLFGDIPGELVASVLDTDSSIAQIKCILRADRLGIVIDGNKLSDRLERRPTIARTRDLLRSLIDNNLITERLAVDLVVTKWDLVSDKKAEKAVEEQEQILREQFSSQLRQLSIWRTAARSDVSSVESGLGLEKMLSAWVRQRLGPSVVQQQSAHYQVGREFDRFLDGWNARGETNVFAAGQATKKEDVA